MIPDPLPGWAFWASLAMVLLSALFVGWTILSPSGRQDERTRFLLGKAAAATLPWVLGMLAAASIVVACLPLQTIHPLPELAIGCLVYDLALLYYRRKYGGG